MLESIIVHAGTFASAMAAGGLAIVSLGIVRATSQLDERAWPSLHRALDATIGPYMARALILALATTLLSAIFGPPTAQLAFAIAAALFAGVMAISLAVNVPINRSIARWTTAPPDWSSVRARWNRFQHLRAAGAVAALVIVLGQR